MEDKLELNFDEPLQSVPYFVDMDLHIKVDILKQDIDVVCISNIGQHFGCNIGCRLPRNSSDRIIWKDLLETIADNINGVIEVEREFG